jgi:dihydrolipoamide dehydrogenase
VYEAIEVRIPDIGDYTNVPIIEVHVQPGATIKVDDPLITLESDKATMEVPAAHSGTIGEVRVKDGDRVSQGDVIAVMEGGASISATPLGDHAPGQGQAGYGSSAVEARAGPKGNVHRAPAPTPKPPVAAAGDFHAEVLVLGAGPGGYTAAFRAADLGKNVVLVDRWPSLGGVCLNVGCIPSKALLHAARVIDESRAMGAHGIGFAEPSIDIEKLRGWKDGVVKRLTGGLAGLAKQRKVTVVPGVGRFVSMNQLEVRSDEGSTRIVSFEQAIIAAGSEPVTLPFIPHDDPRVIDSTGALELDGVPQRLLVIGGGIIGLEMATVYHALGAKVTVVELMDQIIPGADKDIITPLMKRISKQYEAIHLKAKVTNVDANGQGLTVHFEGGSAPATDTFDKILVAVGRRPNGKLIGAENAGIAVDAHGFIPVDRQMRTNVPHIFAIGDIVGQPMLAHKAVHEGKVAAETTAG